MKYLYGLALGALLTLAGGCVTIGADEAGAGGRLMPVGDDAADFARARTLVLDEDMGQLGDIQGVLQEQRELSSKIWQDWRNRSADVWIDPHFLPKERPYVAGGYDGLAQESMDQAGRYRDLMGDYDSRVSFMTAQRNTQQRNVEAFGSMRLVAP